MKKIILIYPRVLEGEGVGRCVLETVKRLNKLGVKIEVIAEETEYSENLEFHKIRTISKPLFIKYIIFALKATLYLKKLSQDYIIHTIWTSALFGDVITVHSCQKAAIRAIRKSSLYDVLKVTLNPISHVFSWIEKKLLNSGRYQIVIAVSQGVKNEIQECYNVPKEKIVVIPNGVDLERFTPTNKILYREKIRERYGILKDEVVLLFIANWGFRHKGLSYLIESLAYLKISNFKLLIIGSSKKVYTGLAKKIGVYEKIIWILPTSDIEKFYSASDIFVFPSFYESFSLVVLEAMASGLPVIATRVNGVTDRLIDGYNGFFVERVSHDIASKINVLVKDKELLVEMGRHARESVLKYSWDYVTIETIKVYNKIVKMNS